MSRNLPLSPNLDHLKKQAKALLRELQQSGQEAQLTQAQHAIAREYGFASWAKLKTHVESQASGGGGTPSGPIAPASADDSGRRGSLFPRFTEKAKRMIFYARFLANTGTLVEANHLFMGLAHEDGDLINRLLGPSIEQKMRQTFERLAESREKPPFGANISLSNDSKRIVELAAEEADRLQHERISTGHFLLGFLHEENSVASRLLTGLLKERGMSIAEARDQITPLLEL